MSATITMSQSELAGAIFKLMEPYFPPNTAEFILIRMGLRARMLGLEWKDDETFWAQVFARYPAPPSYRLDSDNIVLEFATEDDAAYYRMKSL